MIRRNHQIGFTLILFLIFICTVHAQQTDEGETIKDQNILDGSIRLEYGSEQNFLQDKGSFKRFHVSLDKTQKKDGKRIFLLVEGMDLISEPEIYVLTKKKQGDLENKWPEYFLERNLISEIDFQAVSYERGLIDIEEDLVTLDDIRIQVRCETRCMYTFQVYHETQNTLSVDGSILIHIDRQSGEAIATLDIKNSQLITNLIYEFELINQYQNAHWTFDAYINYQEVDGVPTKQNFSSYGKGWGAGAGMGIIFLEGQKLKDGKVKVLFVGQPGMVIQVRAISYNTYRDVEPYELVNDFLNKDQQEKYFIMNMESVASRFGADFFEDDDIIISVTNFQGDSDMQVTLLREKPTKSWTEVLPTLNFELESTNTGDDSITITPTQLKSLKYVVIRVNTTFFSLFALRVYPLQQDVENYLILGYGETAELEPDELITYRLLIEGNKIPTLISIILKPLFGQPNLYISQCFNEQCDLSLSDIKDSQNELKNQYKLMYSVEEGVQKFLIENQPKDCDEDGICTYIVGVHSPKQSSKFYLVANHNISHNVLQENKAFHDLLYYGNKNHYKFTVHNSEFIQSIKFELTYLHGEVSMFLSTSNQYPDINSWEQVSFFNQIKVEQVKTNVKEYFLTIQGDSVMADYTIQVSVTYKDTNYVSWYQLYNDEYTELTFESNSQRQYFEFFYHPGATKKVLLSLFSSVGEKFDVYISENDHHLPSEKNFKYKSIGEKKMTIEFGAISSGALYGVIIPQKSPSQNDTKAFTRVGIKLNDEQQLLTIDIGKIFKGDLLKNDKMEARIKLLNSQPIIIQKKAYHSDQRQFQVEVGLINDKSEHVSGFIPHGEPLYLSQQEIVQICPQLDSNYTGNKKQSCFIHLKLMSNEHIEFQLLVDYENKIQNLFADLHQLVKLQKIVNNYTSQQTFKKQMYYYVHSVDDIEIFIGKINSTQFPDVFINFDEVSGYSNRSQWNWPTRGNKQYQITNDGQYQDEMTIPKSRFEECERTTRHCVLLLTAEYQSFEPSESYSFPITINHQVMQLYEGHPERSTVGSDELAFFKVRLPLIAPVESLMIYLVQLNEVEPIMYVSQDRKPTMKDFNYTTDAIQQTISIPITSSNAKSVFYIGVRSSVEGLDSSVLVYYELLNQTRISPVHLEPSLPIQKVLEKDEVAYFLIPNPPSHSGFQILVSRDVGRIVIRANSFDQVDWQNAYLDNLPSSAAESFLSSDDQAIPDYLTVSAGSVVEGCQFWKSCYWIVGVEASEYSYFQIQYVRFDNPVYLMIPNQIEKIYWESHRPLRIKVLIESAKFVLEYISLYGNIELNVWDARFNKSIQLIDGPDYNKQYLMREIELQNQPENGFSDHYQINFVEGQTVHSVKAFLLSAKIEGHPQRIAFGIPHRYRLKSKGQQFYFQNHFDPAQHHSVYSVQLIFPEYKQTSSIYNNFRPQLNLTFLHPNGTEVITQFSNVDHLNGATNMKISGISSEGIYLLNISYQSPLEYIIIINQDSNVRLIQPNQKIFELDYENAQKKRSYELYIPDESYNILFQFESCSGVTSYSFSKGFDHRSNKQFALGQTMEKISRKINKGELDNEDMDIEMLQRNTRTHLLYIQPKYAGTFFINTLQLKSKKDNVYSFSTYFTKTEFHPALHMGFKNGGFIEFYNHHPNTHSFGLEKLDCLDMCSEITKNYKFLSFTYIIAYSNDLQKLSQNFQCHNFDSGDMGHAEDRSAIHGFQKVEVEPGIRGYQHREEVDRIRLYIFKKSINKSFQDHKYIYFMGKVVAHVQDKETNQVQSITFYHQGASFTKSQVVGYSPWTIAFIVILSVLIIASIGVGVYYIKVRKIDKGSLTQEKKIELEQAKGSYEGHHQLNDEV